MKGLLALLLAQAIPLIAQPPGAASFRYERSITVPSVADSTAVCATLDAAVYAHAAPSLKDVRLYAGKQEVPYAITLSESEEAESEPATVRNLGQRGEAIVFDLAMPARPYTEVLLDLDTKDFIASAEVMGDNSGSMTNLGTYTLFDLSAQHLGRSTTLPLQESSFPVLHVVLHFAGAPGSSTSLSRPEPNTVRGATVPPSREAQTLYTTVAQTASLVERDRETVARLPLPAHVPVERVSIALAPEFTGNFSRDVAVTARTRGNAGEHEELTGLVERVHLERAGREIRQEQLGFAATLGANLQEDATVEVRIENNDDAPLPVRVVRLEMRERRLCFPVGLGKSLTLLYGNPMVEAPRYDFARLFSPSARLLAVALSAEELNHRYVAAPQPLRSMTERHPEFLWVVLLATVCVLAVVAIHSAKQLPR